MGEEIIRRRHEIALRASINKMRLNNILTDVILVCGQREFPAHQIVLLSCVHDDLKNSFDFDFDENSIKTIHLPPTVSEEAVEIILNYVYTGRLAKNMYTNAELFNKCVLAAACLHFNEQFHSEFSHQDKKFRNADATITSKEPYNFVSSLISVKHFVKNDITIICEEEEFEAHCVILSAVSPYFQAMFASDWVETQTRRISMPTISAQGMRSFLDFVYSGRLEPSVINFGALRDIFETAHLLQISGLQHVCLKRFLLEDSDYQELYALSVLYNLAGLEAKLVTFLVSRFHLMTGSEYCEITFDKLERILKHPGFKKLSTENIIRKILLWVEFDFLKRGKYILEMISLLDLTDLPKKFKKSLILKKYPEIKSIWQAQAPAQFLTKSKLSLAFHKIIGCSSQRSKGFTDGQHIIFFGDIDCYGFSATRAAPTMQQICNVDSKKKFPVTILPEELPTRAAVVGFDRFVYFFGGENDEAISKKIYRYCPATNSMLSSDRLNFAVADASAGVLDDVIYVVGGEKSTQQESKIVQRFTPASNTCDVVASANKLHFKPVVFSFQGMLYVFSGKAGVATGYGGREEWVKGGVLECYDSLTNQWTIVTEISKAVTWYNAGHSSGKLYLTDTISGSYDVHVYDIISGNWSSTDISNVMQVSIRKFWPVMKHGKEVFLIADTNKSLRVSDDLSCSWGCDLKEDDLLLPWERRNTAVVNNLHLPIIPAAYFFPMYRSDSATTSTVQVSHRDVGS